MAETVTRERRLSGMLDAERVLPDAEGGFMAESELPVHPVGYLQLTCMGAILAAAALRLPARTLTFLDDEIAITIINANRGRLVFLAVAVATVLAALQLAFLRHPVRGTNRRPAALAVAAAGLVLGVALTYLGLHIGYFEEMPEDLRPSPGLASGIVILAGAVYAWLGWMRLFRLLIAPPESPVPEPPPAPPNDAAPA